MDDGLSPQEFRLVQHARRALAETIEAVAPPDQVLPLVVLAVCGIFADLCSVSTATPDLIAAINQQLRGAGLELRPIARN
jgi:hypothetical protein